jgi:hypothetical protein
MARRRLDHIARSRLGDIDVCSKAVSLSFQSRDLPPADSAERCSALEHMDSNGR